MARTLSILIVSAFILAACDTKPSADQPVGAKPPKTGIQEALSATPAATAVKQETPAVKPEGLAGAAAQTGKESITQAVARTAEKAGAAEATAGALDPSVTADKLEGLIESLKPAGLEELAGKLADAIQGQNGVIEKLKEQIANLGAGDILGDKGVELKKSLEDAAASLTALTDKLKVVIEKLEAEGVDISRFTKLLGGE